MIGKTISHYKILEELGRGGMGVVYKAEDTKLKREVAIKFLPHYISANEEERQRFEIEAQAAAALNHSNIAHIYAIEESDDEMFIVMEYINGVELKDKVKSGKIQTEEAINIAHQIAEGLGAAHKKGIVHRDIKSSNIMITNDGKAKIMDFGLAKIGQGVQVTKIGSTIGTAAYMSPEQSKGEEVDHRTDIWSFGIVLYEMLAGQLPFKGDYEQAIIYSILNEEIQPVSKLNPNIPELLDEIIGECLKKNKQERYKNIDEIIDDLQKFNAESSTGKTARISTQKNFRLKKKPYIIYGVSIILTFLAVFFLIKELETLDETDASINSPKRLAVLPFTNIKNDVETNYLGFALADQIIGSLAYVQNILVRPSSAIRKYENQKINTSEVGQELNVDFILTGNYLKESDMVRLNLELIDVKLNEIIMRNDFDVTYKNAFTLQDIVTEKVVSGLKVKFTNEVKYSETPKDPLAYEYYLKALSYPLTTEANRIALTMLKKAIELDSTYAPVYSELGFRYQMLSSYDLKSRNKIMVAETLYLKALSINKNLLSAVGNLASLYTETGKTIGAVELIKRALDINPNNANAHFWLGYIYRYTGMLEESANEMEKALKLDPNNPRFRSLGTTYAYMKRYDESIRSYELDNESAFSKSWIGFIYFRMNKIDFAKKYLSEAINLDPNGTLGIWAKALLEYISGNKENGLKLIKALEMSNTHDGEQIYEYANLYGLYGEKEECIRTLIKAVDTGFYCYPLFLNDVFLESVRDDPVFQELLILTKKKSEDFRKSISEL